MPIEKLSKTATSDEAKQFARKYCTPVQNKKQAQSTLEQYESFYKNSLTEKDKSYWEQEIKKQSAWVSSDECINSTHPQSIDAMLFQIFEWRAMIYAFSKVETSNDPFDRYVFFQQWLVGGTYAIFSKLGKLVDQDSRGHSSRTTWNQIEKFIRPNLEEEEFTYISNLLKPKSSHFQNEKSNAFRFRNKVIAHNETSGGANWEDLDNDLCIITRVWSIILKWTGDFYPIPFRTEEIDFSGLRFFYTSNEMSALKSAREEYLRQFPKWCTTALTPEDS